MTVSSTRLEFFLYDEMFGISCVLCQRDRYIGTSECLGIKTFYGHKEVTSPSPMLLFLSHLNII